MSESEKLFVGGSLVRIISASLVFACSALLGASGAGAAPPPAPSAQVRTLDATGAPRLVVLTGVVRGVTAGQRGPIRGAAVVLRAAGSQTVVASVVTDKTGRYAFGNPAPDPSGTAFAPDIPNGRYQLRARFHQNDVDAGTIPLVVSQTARHDVDLGSIVRAGGAAPPPPRVTFYATDRVTAASAGDIKNFYGNTRITTPCMPGPACLMHYGMVVPAGPLFTDHQPAADLEALLAQMHAQYPAATKVLVFVHGFNNDFFSPFSLGATVVSSYASSPADEPVIVYSWPSNAKVLKYVDDETNNTWASDHFRDFLLALLSSPNAPPRVDVMAHSMGSRLVVDALSYLSRARATTHGSVGQVVFAAPDVDAGTFYEALPDMAGVAKGVTRYGSTHDEALRGSRQLHGHCRAGLVNCDEAVPALPHIDAIDASLFSCDFLGHGYWNASSTMADDIRGVLLNGTMENGAPRAHLERVGTSNRFAFTSFASDDAACGAQANDAPP